jgi:hypothetical protein
MKWQKFYLDFPPLDPTLLPQLDQLSLTITPADTTTSATPNPEFWLDELTAYQLTQSASPTQKMAVISPPGRFLQTQVIVTSSLLPLSAQFTPPQLTSTTSLDQDIRPSQRLRGGKGFLGNRLSSFQP